MVPGAAGFDEWVQRALSLATPIVLTPIELQQNYSTFFRDKIESDTSPLVTAPSYVGKFPDSWKQKLGVTRGTDNRTGKTVWRWPGRLDFVAHAVPGPTSYAQRFATESSRGQTLGNELLGYAGIKATKFDPVTTVVGIAYDRMSEIQKEQASLRQQLHNGKPINADNPTPEYERLADQLGLVEEVAYGAKDIRGDAVLPTAGAPRKIVRKKKPNGWDSAGSSSNEWGESSSSSGWSRPSASSSGW
jgi:hypothetical protein